MEKVEGFEPLGDPTEDRVLRRQIAVVEHDEEAILLADHVVDLGPGAGLDGGEVVAEGRPVKFRQQAAEGPVEGEARHVEYEVDSENLLMAGDAVLIQGKDSMRSDRIAYDRVRAVVKAGAAAKGKQRVRISIQPPSD